MKSTLLYAALALLTYLGATDLIRHGKPGLACAVTAVLAFSVGFLAATRICTAQRAGESDVI